MCRTLKDIPHAIQMSYCSAGQLSNAQMGSTGEKKTPIKALYQQTGSSRVTGQVLLTGFGGVLYFRDPLTTKWMYKGRPTSASAYIVFRSAEVDLVIFPLLATAALSTIGKS